MNSLSITRNIGLLSLAATLSMPYAKGQEEAGAGSDNDRIKALEQKTSALERKLEVADEATAKTAADGATVTAKDGFRIAANDKSYELRIAGDLRTDARIYLDDDDDKSKDTFLIRSVRLTVDGKLASKWFFRIQEDFGGGTTALHDAWLDYRSNPAFNVRVGRTKVPVGQERQQGSPDTLFGETGLATELTPNRDEGVLLYGQFGNGVVEYALGAFNGGPDRASVDKDTNDGFDAAARLVVSPFKTTDLTALRGLSVGISGSTGKEESSAASPNLASYRTAGQNGFFSYSTSTNEADTAIADGDRTRLAPQVYYVVGSLGVAAEYVISQQEVSNASSGNTTIDNDAWQVAASYVLTGESPSLRGVKPAKPLDVSKNQWGALELKARAGSLSIDDAAFSGKYADAKKSASKADAAGAGVNWHLTANTKLSLDYEQTSFEGGDKTGDRPDEQVLISSLLVKF